MLLPTKYEEYLKKPYCLKCREMKIAEELAAERAAQAAQAQAALASNSKVVELASSESTTNIVSPPEIQRVQSPERTQPFAASKSPDSVRIKSPDLLDRAKSPPMPTQAQPLVTEDGKLVSLTKSRVKLAGRKPKTHARIPSAFTSEVTAALQQQTPLPTSPASVDLWALVDERKQKEEQERKAKEALQKEEERKREEERRVQEEARRSRSIAEQQYEEMERKRAEDNNKRLKEQQTKSYEAVILLTALSN